MARGRKSLDGREKPADLQGWPIYERWSTDGRLMGFVVKIAKKGHPTVTRLFGEVGKTPAALKAEAKRYATSVLGEMDRGTFVDRREIEAITLADALDKYDREVGPQKKRPDGVTAYVRRWKRHALAPRIVASLRPSDFAKYRDERLAAGLSGNAVRLDLGLIRHLFTIGIKEWGWPMANPVSLIRMPKCASGRDRRLSTKADRDGKVEETRLIEACKDSRSKWLEPVVRLALETGARQGELLDLTWSRVDLRRATAHFPDTKTETPRTIPLSREAIKILKTMPGTRLKIEIRRNDQRIEWKRLHHDLKVKARRSRLSPSQVKTLQGLVPSDDRVFPLGGMAVTHAFQRACKKAGIENLRFHDLRHEAVSRLFEKGLNPMKVAAISGHKTLQMLKRYTHLRAEDIAKELG